MSSSGTQYFVPSAAAWDASLTRAEHAASEQARQHGSAAESRRAHGKCNKICVPPDAPPTRAIIGPTTTEMDTNQLHYYLEKLLPWASAP